MKKTIGLIQGQTDQKQFTVNEYKLFLYSLMVILTLKVQWQDILELFIALSM